MKQSRIAAWLFAAATLALSPVYAAGTNLDQVVSYNANFLGYETVPLTATTSSSSVTFALTQSATNDSVMVSNAGSVAAFINCGTGSVTAQLPGTNGTTGATPVLPGAIMVFKKNTGSNANKCAAITGSGSTTLYFTSGQGS